MANVCLKNITKSFGAGKNKKTVLDDISLEIKDKSFCVLLGESGCGKSTLLRLIAGLEVQDSGSVFIDNIKADNLFAKDRDVAFVFQSYALYPHLNVYDNIAFPLKIKGLNKKTIDEKVKNAADILGLNELLKRKPKELSGGQRQRVALGRAIVRDAKVYLMDEPLSNLDAKLRANMRLELKKLHRRLNATFIYVTHDQLEALTMADHIVILDNGKISQQGEWKDILYNPANTFVASFSGSCPMNLAETKVKDGKFLFSDKWIELPENVKNKAENEIIFGIRPECIKISNEKSDFNAEFKVSFVENGGAIKTLYVEKEDLHLRAVIGAIDINAQENFTFYFNISDFYFFDPKTKERI